MSTAPTPKETLPFTDGQKLFVGKVTQAARILAVVLLACGAVLLVSGPAALLTLDVGLLNVLLIMAQGAVTALLGLVMLACASDCQYLGEYVKYRGNHLRNLAKNLTVFHQVLMGLAAVILLTALVRWLG